MLRGASEEERLGTTHGGGARLPRALLADRLTQRLCDLANLARELVEACDDER
jgi:hypothetical protein